ncbi:MAG: M15 family metallopeptidase [Ruminococcus sp.]|nr:M15 family metallopeptidase [Ruminococcus sp.]
MKKKRILFTAFAVASILLIAKNFSELRQIDIISNVPYDSNAEASYIETSDDWRLILVNSKNAVPKDYKIELTKLSNGICVDSRIYPDLQQMFDDARNDGVYPVVSEGYRTHEEQQNMMNDKIDSFIYEGYSKNEAKKLAENWVAEAGKSEHELGLALDINADTFFSSDEEVYNWLAENAYKYGFILRYPPDKKYITGIDYEPWHYRYVGTETAYEIYSRQVTLEEYLDNTE